VVRKVQVYAVVRLNPQAHHIVDETVVQSVLPTIEEARFEAERLNTLNGDHGSVYFVRATRWYPDGRARTEASGSSGPPP
jgi:hypothetical protein